MSAIHDPIGYILGWIAAIVLVYLVAGTIWAMISPVTFMIFLGFLGFVIGSIIAGKWD